MKWNRGLFALALAVCLGLTACGRGEPEQPPAPLGGDKPPAEAAGQPETYFLFAMGGIAFYIPSYYEIDQAKSAEDVVQFDARREGELCFRLIFSRQRLDVDLSPEEFLAHKEDFFRAARGEDSDSYQVVSRTEGSLAGLPCETATLAPADPQADIRLIVHSYTFNTVESTAVWVWLGVFADEAASAQADYRKMLETATVMPARPEPPQRLLRALPAAASGGGCLK